MEDYYIKAKDIVGRPEISFEDSFEVFSICSKLLSSGEHESLGRDLLVRSLDRMHNFFPSARHIMQDLVDCAGLYPYMSDALSGVSAVRREFHRSECLSNVYLHSSQRHVSDLLASGKNVVLSAPTSYGKSLLIHEAVASGRYNNIVIIQPTLALLDETRKALVKYKDYKIIVSTRQDPGEGGNIFLFTAERVLEYDRFPVIDFFVVDEFYKLSLSRDDDRAIVLNQAFYRMSKIARQYYMLGPLVTDLDDGFKRRQVFDWVRTDYATVAVDEHFIGEYKQKEEPDKKRDLFNLLENLDEPTLIYCSSPDKTYELATDFLDYLDDHGSSISTNLNDDLSEWCNENIHESWRLRRLIENSVAVHHGELPRHVGSSLVDMFNDGSIQYLFCTATLIEGVNTSAKNIVLYHKKKGPKKIDFFDFKNISGRAGRMRKHFVGNVYKMEREPEQLSFDVDIPIVSQDGAPDDILMFIDRDELTPDSLLQISKYDDIDEHLMQLVRKNSGMPIEGQISLVREVASAKDMYRDVLCWSRFPTYDQLSATLGLGWQHLLRNTDSKGRVKTYKQLAFFTSKYFLSKSIYGFIRALILNGNEEQEAISIALSLQRSWFQFKLPKMLITVSNLVEYVYGEGACSYHYYAAQIEHGFLPPNLSDLVEYNIPVSLAKKIQKFVSEEDSLEEILHKIRSVNWSNLGLLAYEEKQLRKLIS